MAQNQETETFQHFQVLRRPDGSLHELGRGAMGITYKAFDTNLRSQVALKVINAMYLHSDTAKARFLREARAAAGLRHRNVASVYHLGNDEQSYFYAMEFIDGETIAGLIEREGPLPVGKALHITLQVARALGAAHRQQIVHRDIKPANLMVCHEDEDDDDEEGGGGNLHVKVIDFGLARSAVEQEGGSSGPITMGGFVGTAQFASPEQLQEHDLDTRSDIYSLGITLWFMLCGRAPFSGSMFSLYSQHMTKEPPWEQLGDTVPESVRAVLAKMLKKSPAERFQNPAELRRALESCLSDLSLPHAAGHRAGGGEGGSDSSLSPASSHPHVEAAPPEPAKVGNVLGRRYRLLELVAEGRVSQVFQASDSMRGGKLVALRLLRANAQEAPEELTRLRDDFSRLRASPHQHLLAPLAIGRHGHRPYLVLEWVSGFTLVNLLRRRGRLKLREALLLMRQAAGAADHALSIGLERLELGARDVLMHFPAATVAGVGHNEPVSLETRMGEAITDWPAFSAKLNALNISPDAAANDVATGGGDLTMVPAPRLTGRDTQSSILGLQAGGYLTALATLIYELLNGAPPHTGSAAAYVSLGALNEAANGVLHQALGNGGLGEPAFPSCREFFVALARTSGFDPQELDAASAVTEEVAPAEAPEDEDALETMVDGLSAHRHPADAAGSATEGRHPSSSVAGAASVVSTPPPPQTEAPPRVAVATPPVPVRPATQPTPALAPVPHSSSHNGLLWAAVAVLLVAFAGAGGFVWWQQNHPAQKTGGTTSPQPTAAPTASVVVAPSPTPEAGPMTLLVPDKYPTLQAAIDAARPGDTVRLKAGSYRGPFNFKEGIRLEGTDASSCVLMPAANADAAPSILSVLNCRSGTIENLTFDGAGGPAVDGIALEDSNVNLVNLVVTNMGGNGITVRELRSRPTIRNVRCVGNKLHGLIFERGAGGSLEESTFENNGSCGIIVGDRDSAPRIRNNRCVNNVQHGINVLRGCRPIIEKNTLTDNGFSGIAITGESTVPELRENRCTDNKQHGLGYAKGSGGVAENNVLEHNVKSGILVDGSDTAPTLRNNQSLQNGENGLTYQTAGGGIAEGNTLEANSGCGILISDALTTPKLINNVCRKNKQYGIALVNAARLTPDSSNKLSENVLGPVLLNNTRR